MTNNGFARSVHLDGKVAKEAKVERRKESGDTSVMTIALSAHSDKLGEVTSATAAAHNA